MAGCSLTDGQLELLMTIACSLDPSQGETLGEALEKANLDKQSKEFQAACGLAMADPALSSLKLADVHSFPSGEHRAFTFEDSDGNPIVVFQGTTGVGDGNIANNGDLIEDLALGFLADTRAQKEVSDYISEVHGKYNKGIVVTGHSLGGNLAEYVAITSPHVYRCVAFNSPGFSVDFIMAHYREIGLNTHKITLYCNADDNISNLLTQLAPKVVVHGNVRKGYMLGIGNHLMSGMYIYAYDENGNCYIVYTCDGQYAGGTFHGATQLTMPSSNEIRDFSQSKLNELLGIIDDIDNESFFDVGNWAMWSSIESAFGRLKPEHYRENMSRYYHNVMDKNKTSKQEIETIFERARERDELFASNLAQMSSSFSSFASMEEFLA